MRQMMIVHLLAAIAWMATSAYGEDGRAIIDHVDVRSARGVTADHAPLDPQSAFPDGTDRIFITFKSLRPISNNRHRLNFDLFSHAAHRKLYTSKWIRFGAGETYSTVLDASKLRLEPGRYRVALRSGRKTANLDFDIVPEHPTAHKADRIKVGTLALDDGRTIDVSGVNLALADLGGRIVTTSQRDDTSWSKTKLNDGISWVAHLNRPGDCALCGWMSAKGDRNPEIVVSFHRNREAAIAAVILDTRVFPWTGNAAYLVHLPKYVDIWASSATRDSGFWKVASAHIARQPRRQIVPMPQGLRATHIKIAVSQTHGGDAVTLGEVEIVETSSGRQTILHDREVDLARFALGGALVHFTSYLDEPVAHLFTGDDRAAPWRSRDAYLPQDFTIAFAGDQSAYIDRLRIALPEAAPAATWPSRIALSVSAIHPLDGFVEIGRFDVAKRAGAQAFPVSREARFIKLRLLNNHGGPYTSLSEIAVIEGRRAGYTSILLRRGPAASDAGPSREGGEAKPVGTIKGDTTEIEPNNDMAAANLIALDQVMTGAIDPVREVDFFRLPDLGPNPTALMLAYAGQPHIRHALSLLDRDGTVISHFDPGDLPASEALLTFAWQGEAAFLKVSEPPTSVVVVWDSSGSMSGRTADLEAAVREYIRRAPAGQKINFVRFGRDVSVLIDEFTSDKPRLHRALFGQFKAAGGTRFYDAIEKATALLETRAGNKAIVVMSDGEDTGSDIWHGAFWKAIAQHRIRLYTIGLGDRMASHSLAFATSGKRQLGHLALATDGKAFFTSESSALPAFYARIANELSRPAHYALRPTVAAGSGSLRLVSAGAQMPDAALPAIHLIFDVSGSMSERRDDGRRRIDVAKEALAHALAGLPDGIPFGLTVYGARIPEKPDKALACTDIVTVQEMAPLHKRRVLSYVQHLTPRGGTTPLARSIARVVNAFKSDRGGIVIVITDGVEECDPEPLVTVAQLEDRKLDKIELNVIGFALDDPSARDMMEKIAALGGGQFYDASDGEAVAAALRAAMTAVFKVKDASGRTVASGKVNGDEIALPPGVYDIEIAAAGAAMQTRDVRIVQDQLTTVRVNQAGREVDIAAAPPASRADRQACGTAALMAGEARRDARVQEKLNDLGFHVGAPDNTPGPKTMRAIAAFVRQYDLPLPATISALLEQHLDCVRTVGSPYWPPGTAASK